MVGDFICRFRCPGLLPETGVDGAYDAFPDSDTVGWFWYDTNEKEIIATIFPERYPIATPNESQSGPFLLDSDEDVSPTETLPLDPKDVELNP